MTSTDPRPFQPLDDRLAGKPVDDVLLEGVPPHLERPLREWVEDVIGLRYTTDDDLAKTVVVSLKWSPNEGRGYKSTVADVSSDMLLTVVDALLFFSEAHGAIGQADIEGLDLLLLYGSSLYQVNDEGDGLTRRVDPTAKEAFHTAVTGASPTAADLLRKAWHFAYRPEPDPTAAYGHAVRAVEEAFVPAVSPRNTRASLGTVARDLENQQEKWELVLVDGADTLASIAPFVALLNQLWQGQRSRHGGSSISRDQRQEEAEAAVHLAVLAVQWLTSGALRSNQ